MTTTNTFNYIDIESALNNEPPPINFVLPGLAAATVGMINGTGAAGKTNFALSTAISIVLGIPVAGGVWSAPEAGKVTILAAEDPDVILLNRIHSQGKWLAQQYPGQLTNFGAHLQDSLFIASLVGRIPHIVDGRGEINAQWYDAVAQAASGSRLLIIDTLRRFFGGEENDSGAVTKFLQILERIAQETGCAIIFTHHAAKAAVLNGQASMAQAARGSSALTDNIRWQCNLAGMTEAEAKKLRIPENLRSQYVRLDITKSNYGPPTPTQWLQRVDGGVLEAVDIGRSPSALKPVKDNNEQLPSSLDELM